MEQHPVPQNVTTFQFRLIGDMTIKQFGYLAGGAVGAYICYKLPLPFFFTWPLAVSLVLLGIGLAFVPIEERPMDVWLLSFIKSIYSPTQYLWQKTKAEVQQPIPPQAPTVAPATGGPGVLPKTSSLTQTLEHLFAPGKKPAAGAPAAPTSPPAPLETPGKPPERVSTSAAILSQRTPWDPFAFFKQLFSRPQQAARVTTPPPSISSAPASPAAVYPDVFAHIGLVPSLTGKKVSLEQPTGTAPLTPQQQAQATQVQQEKEAKEKELTEKLEKLQTELATSTSRGTTTDARILELQNQLTDVLSQRSKMETELTRLRQQLTQTQQTPQVVRQAGTVPTQTTSAPTVRVITPETAVRAGLPRLTTFANVVTGIIKDAEGNLLPGVLVTVRDKDEIPVRALKTNKIGQFAASTQLVNGTYTVDIEDPRGLHFFDRIRITINGSVMAPLEVTSKSKREMDRGKLAQEIFGGPKM